MQKLSSLIIAIYITALLYANLFFIKQLTLVKGADQLFWNHLAIFAIILVPVFFLINKYISAPVSRGAMKPLRFVLLFVALLGLVFTILYHIIPLEPIYNLPAQVDQVFASEMAFTIWLIAPLVVLFL
ncbi:MAG: hypothetical protein AAB690_01215 [Patescibacteria group bacterium]